MPRTSRQRRWEAWGDISQRLFRKYSSPCHRQDRQTLIHFLPPEYSREQFPPLIANPTPGGISPYLLLRPDECTRTAPALIFSTVILQSRRTAFKGSCYAPILWCRALQHPHIFHALTRAATHWEVCHVFIFLARQIHSIPDYFFVLHCKR